MEPLIYQRFLRHMDVPLANQWRKPLIRREPSSDMCRTRRALNNSGRIVQRFLDVPLHYPVKPRACAGNGIVQPGRRSSVRISLSWADGCLCMAFCGS